MTELFSIFTITKRDGTVLEGEGYEGSGQELMRYLRKEYPRFTKFVLKGFEINGVYKPVNLRTHNYIR